MADIIIKGMEMPKYATKAELGIDSDGNPLCIVYHEDGTEPDIYDVFPLPEGHGKIVDAGEIRTRLSRKLTACKPGTIEELTFAVSIDIVDHADTIVPSERGEVV